MSTILGTDESENLSGTDGDDVIRGFGGNDRIITNNGQDTVYGGPGNDEINGYLTGENSWVRWDSDGPLLLFGDQGDDVIIGSSSSDEIYGGDGNDFVVGQTGNDFVDGGDGEDAIYGIEGDNLLIGGDGNDYITVFSYDGNNDLQGGPGNDELYGGSGNDRLDGGEGDDEIYGYEGDNVLIGGNGNDYLSVFQNFGDNELRGGPGDDELYGGSGNDTLDGGKGFDLLWGYEGNDSYVVSSRDFYIYDSAGVDSLTVNASFVKVPSSIENVEFGDGVLPLPYWLDALLYDDGARYASLIGDDRTFYFGFPEQSPGYHRAEDKNGFTPFNETQRGFAREVLSYLETLVDLTFVETTEFEAPNTIAFVNNMQVGSAGYAQFPDDGPIGSDVFLDTGTAGNLEPKDGEFAALTFIHELGHALGLKHPFSYADAFGEIPDPPYLPSQEENTSWTVISYNDSPEDFHARFQPLDIAALQYIYGPSSRFKGGDDIHTLDESVANFIWDGGGIDLIDASNLASSVTVYLEPGYWGFIGTERAELISNPGQITVNFGTSIENLVGSSFSDELHGTEQSNSIDGGDGDDLVFAGAGSDVIQGGAGDDTLYGGDGIDFAVYSGELVNFTALFDGNELAVEDSLTLEVDTLFDIERLVFDDLYLAFDLDGNAGAVVKLLGAMLGKDQWYNREFVGIGLDLLDNGGLSFEAVMDMALDVLLGNSRSNESVVSLLYNNLVGITPSPGELTDLVGLLDNGTYTQTSLAVAAAEHPLNADNINLVGLVEFGVEFYSMW